MNLRIIIMFVLILTITPISNAEENEYGVVKAWFDGKNATVEGVKLKIGETADVKVTVTSNITGHVFVQLTNPLVTEPYNVLNGPKKIGEYIDNYDVIAGWSNTYTWTLVPNGAWKNGNAPINVFVQFTKIENGKIKGDKKIEFTIADPYILDEQYEVGNIDSTPILTSTPTPTITVTPTPTPIPTYTGTPTITPTVSPSPIATSNVEQEIKELRERLNKTEEKQSQQESRISWLENVINSIIDRIKSIF